MLASQVCIRVYSTPSLKALGQIRAAVAHLSPLPLVMLTSFSMPPVSAKALAFSMFLLVTSCRVQQMAATVSSDSRVVFPPGRRLTRSLIAYFPERGEGKGDMQLKHYDILYSRCEQKLTQREKRGKSPHIHADIHRFIFFLRYIMYKWMFATVKLHLVLSIS